MFHINHYGELTSGSLELDAIRARLEKLRQKSFDQKQPGLGHHAGRVSISILNTRFKVSDQTAPYLPVG